MPPNGVLLLDVLCTCVSARCEPRRLFRLPGPLGVWRTVLSKLFCDFAAWFPALPELLSVVCRCSWSEVCSAAASWPRDSANCGVAALFTAVSLWLCFRKFSDEVVANADLVFSSLIRCSRPGRRRPLHIEGLRGEDYPSMVETYSRPGNMPHSARETLQPKTYWPCESSWHVQQSFKHCGKDDAKPSCKKQRLPLVRRWKSRRLSALSTIRRDFNLNA